MARHGRFGVFCVRAGERDRRPLSTHRLYERAEAKAAAEMRAFDRQLGVQNALIAYEVYECVDGAWQGGEGN